MKLKMLTGEKWWGGTVRNAKAMPFDETTSITIDLKKDIWTQTAPVYLSNFGRIIWCEQPFTITFEKGEITCSGAEDIIVEEGGSTLREGYLTAMRKYFPFEKNFTLPRAFFKYPQFNSWMELIKDQTQDEILAFAEEIVANGYGAGVLMIDDGWQESIGSWRFNARLFPEHKKMMDRLHELGFKVMLWVAPYVSGDSTDFIRLIEPVHNDGKEGTHLVRTQTGEVAVFHWWNGYSAALDMRKEADVAYLDGQLQALMNDYGVDGFKFDGGSYMAGVVNGKLPEDTTPWELSRVWTEHCATYTYHEFKDTFKAGGKPYVQRLHDKSHVWTGADGMDCLIPAGIFVGLIGTPFICPDMIGGGQWTAFLEAPVDDELFMRMAECSALFPMMQFSYLPWRHTSKACAKVCVDMADLHAKRYPYIEQCIKDAERTGEPIIRSLEYAYSHTGYAEIKDEFLLGENLLVAPVLMQGARSREVTFPKGQWRCGNTGKVYEGEQTISVEAPVECLPWFEKL